MGRLIAEDRLKAGEIKWLLFLFANHTRTARNLTNLTLTHLTVPHASFLEELTRNAPPPSSTT
jgi:hypothetical protein